ncbi:MATE family efflux transporter [Vacuolonema iberomarrocanum]|uniref:MATE family efflux transporter n=1 Tax=Vacuolonema iberomarrocanum TaxID=3454632 RepID=UPI001A09314C|nr:MATE family efflux transporter [filamentous cyanobacterium LEGE 07170]
MVTKVFAKSDITIEAREFIKLAVPLAGAQVAQALVGFVDTLMMGHLGAQSLAAGGLASAVFQLVLNTLSGVVMSVSPLVAEAYGAGNKHQVERIARQGLWLAVLLGLPMMVVISHLDWVMMHLGQAEQTVVLADGYLDYVLWGFVPALGFAMLRGYVAALSQARPVMMIVLFGAIANITGNYVLGYGQFGFPRMELAGLGLASGLSFWFMFLALFLYTCRNQTLKEYPFWRGLHRLRPQILWQLVVIGTSIAVTIAVEYGLFTVVTFFMGTLGTETLAAHQTVYQTVFLLFMVPLGMSYAATVRVGQWMGQRDRAKTQQAGYVGVASAAIFMAITAIALLLFRQPIIGIYLDVNDPAAAGVMQLAIPMLIIAAFAQFLDGVQRVAMGSLYGLQDIRTPMVLSVVTFWGIGLTSGYVLGFLMHLGGIGLWLGQSIGVAFAGVIFLWRFHSLTLPKNFARLKPETTSAHHF